MFAERKEDLWDTVIRTGKKGEIELEKMFYLLLDLQGMLRQEQKEHPDFYRIMELERLEEIVVDARIEIIRIKDLFDRITGNLERFRKAQDPETEKREMIYASDPYYHRAVSEQQKDLYRIWPAKYGLK